MKSDASPVLPSCMPLSPIRSVAYAVSVMAANRIKCHSGGVTGSPLKLDNVCTASTLKLGRELS